MRGHKEAVVETPQFLCCGREAVVSVAKTHTSAALAVNG